MQTIQIDLFAELPPGCRVKQKRARRCGKPLLEQLNRQLSFDLSARVEAVCEEDDGEDDPLVLAPIVQRTVSARDAAPIAINAPCSVFAMAFAPIQLRSKAKPADRIITRVERTDGVVRCVRIMESETNEWREKEAARRARQVVPKPSKAAKTKSAKLRDLIGDDDE